MGDQNWAYFDHHKTYNYGIFFVAIGLTMENFQLPQA